MRISHNLQAMNVQRQLGIARTKKAKAMEKLSSGYRINRAADDAAGLAISEKMRSQIRGLDQGSRNAQDGISLLQVADGALEEVHVMLHRINELSIQASNGTNTDDDREKIQDEITQIISDIDRISETTEFNKLSLFKKNTNSSGNTTITQLVGYKTEYVDKEVDVTKNDTLSVSVSGKPTDTSATNYRILATNDNIKIGSDIYDWSAVLKNDGSGIDVNQSILPGKYSITHHGMNVSFEVQRELNFSQLVQGLNGVSWSTKENIVETMNYSLSANSPKDYSKTIKNHIFEATESALKIDGVEYSWPSELLLGIEKGKAYSFTAGDVEIKLSIGDNNTASFADIINDIGVKTVKEAIGSESRTYISNMKADIEGSRGIAAYGPLLDSYIKQGRPYMSANKDGIYLHIIGMNCQTMTWDELNATKTYYNDSLVKYTYQTETLLSGRDVWQTFTFEFTLDKDMDISDLYTKYNFVAWMDLRKITPPRYEMNGVEYNSFYIETASKRLSETVQYSVFNGTVANNNSTQKEVIYDKINSVPYYNYTDKEVKQEPVQVPIYQTVSVSRPTDSDSNNESNTIWLQTGANNGQGVYMFLDYMNSSVLGIDKIDVTTQKGAQDAITKIKNGVACISKLRSKIGAYQNRLEHTIKYVDNTAENLQQAESRIRDADIAEEVTSLAKHNILEEAGQTILAQANHSKDGILQLIQ